MTLYRGKTAETYVGAVEGCVSEQARKNLALAFDIDRDDDEPDDIGFQEVELAERPGQLAEVLQAFP